MLIRRLRLYASPAGASSALALSEPRSRKRGYPIIHFIVPMGCSTMLRRSFIHLGSLFALKCMASLAFSWKLRTMLRLPALVHCDLRGQPRQALVFQYSFFCSVCETLCTESVCPAGHR